MEPWAGCLFEQDSFVDDRPVLNWQVRWITGLGPGLKRVPVRKADTNGRAFIYRRIEGDRLN